MDWLCKTSVPINKRLYRQQAMCKLLGNKKISGLNYKIKTAKLVILSEVAKFASTISCYIVDRPLYLSDIHVLAIMITVN